MAQQAAMQTGQMQMAAAKDSNQDKLQGKLAEINLTGEWKIKEIQEINKGSVITGAQKAEHGLERDRFVATAKLEQQDVKTSHDMLKTEHQTDENLHFERLKPKEETIKD